jgi:16S rRNA (cytidine1402-2'-O)-methyltransferase
MLPLALYLFPVALGDTPLSTVLPPYNAELLARIEHFIVENERTARRFIKKAIPDADISKLKFYILNQHTAAEEIEHFLSPLLAGRSMGLLSEAGCPAIADPGAVVVAMAHRKGIKVVPLTGPSSILLALMGSGFSGQNFAFVGYLPVEANLRIKRLKQLEQRACNENQTQIMIETPYRNEKLLDAIVTACSPNMLLSIGCNLSCADQWIETHTLKYWKQHKPAMEKKPAIFLLYRE